MNFFTRQIIRGLFAAGIMSVAVTAGAQGYPERDITFIVPFNPGGSSDPLGRAFSAELAKALPGNVNVVNKPGGSATIGTNLVVRSDPDGYTIGLGDSAALAYQPLVNKNLAYKSVDDYSTLINLAYVPAMLVVRADAPWKNFDEFMADVKKNPGKIRAAVSGVRSIADLVVQQLNRAAGVKIATIPFTGGGGEGLIAVLGGRVEASISYGGNAAAQVRAGKLKVLAVFKKGKYDLAPDATPVFDAGFDATIPASYSVIAPKGLPKNVHDKLVAASLQAVKSKEFIAFANNNGFVIDTKGSEDAKKQTAELGVTFAELLKWMDAQ